MPKQRKLKSAKIRSPRAALPPAFIISPIGNKGSPLQAGIREKADYLCKMVIQPALEAAGFEASRMDQRPHAGFITPKMIERLTEEKLAVAVLDGFNPNVMYELAVRHCYEYPVICLCPKDAQADAKLPFDVKDTQVIWYEPLNLPDGMGKAALREAKKELRERAKAALAEGRARTPFHDARRRAAGDVVAELIRKGKLRALEELEHGMKQFEHLAEKDYDVSGTNRKALSKLRDLIGPALESFFHLSKFLHRMVEAELKDGVRGGLDELCEQMNELGTKLADVARLVHPPKKAALPSRADILKLTKVLTKKITACLRLASP